MFLKSQKPHHDNERNYCTGGWVLFVDFKGVRMKLFSNDFLILWKTGTLLHLCKWFDAFHIYASNFCQVCPFVWRLRIEGEFWLLWYVTLPRTKRSTQSKQKVAKEAYYDFTISITFRSIIQVPHNNSFCHTHIHTLKIIPQRRDPIEGAWWGVLCFEMIANKTKRELKNDCFNIVCAWNGPRCHRSGTIKHSSVCVCPVPSLPVLPAANEALLLGKRNVSINMFFHVNVAVWWHTIDTKLCNPASGRTS